MGEKGGKLEGGIYGGRRREWGKDTSDGDCGRDVAVPVAPVGPAPADEDQVRDGEDELRDTAGEEDLGVAEGVHDGHCEGFSKDNDGEMKCRKSDIRYHPHGIVWHGSQNGVKSKTMKTEDNEQLQMNICGSAQRQGVPAKAVNGYC